jgi:hypothetical protein
LWSKHKFASDAAYDLAPSVKVLNGKTKRVIFHKTRVINSKLTSRKKVFDDARYYQDII